MLAVHTSAEIGVRWHGGGSMAAPELVIVPAWCLGMRGLLAYAWHTDRAKRNWKP
jgi:hypothetical protein